MVINDYAAERWGVKMAVTEGQPASYRNNRVRGIHMVSTQPYIYYTNTYFHPFLTCRTYLSSYRLYPSTWHPYQTFKKPNYGIFVLGYFYPVAGRCNYM
jgi:hypothetical protein